MNEFRKSYEDMINESGTMKGFKAPNIGAYGMSATLTPKERKKLKIETNNDELKYWKDRKKETMVFLKIAKEKNMGTDGKPNKPLKYAQPYAKVKDAVDTITYRIQALKSIISTEKAKDKSKKDKAKMKGESVDYKTLRELHCEMISHVTESNKTKEVKTTIDGIFKDTLGLKGNWGSSISVGDIATSKKLENDWEETKLISGGSDAGFDLMDKLQKDGSSDASVIYDTLDGKTIDMAINYKNKWYYIGMSKTPKKILKDVIG
jgi:hypothetical protein